MEKERITLELTPGEVLMLQELTKDREMGYAWLVEIENSLRQKALAAYEKPVMMLEEFDRRVNAVKKLFSGEPVEFHMVHAEKVELRFFYRVEGDE